jgi:uncharacterized protein (DUF4415 family)
MDIRESCGIALEGNRARANLPRFSSPRSKLLQAISIRLDRDILDYFRAAGPRYQSQINAVLRSYVGHVTADTPPRRKRAG